MPVSPQRMDLAAEAPGFSTQMGRLSAQAGNRLDPLLVELVRLRASQINGCAFCMDSHSRDALAKGEDPRRLATVAGWHESPFFSEQERAALALTESVTLVSDAGHVPDDVYREAAEHFGTEDLADLIALIIVINAWNRYAVATRMALPPLQPQG